MADDDFSRRLGEVAEMIGVGDLEGHLEVDQVYAHYQHEGICRFCGRPLVYHGGGGSHYLSAPLTEHYHDYYESVARELLNVEGGGARKAMIEAMKHLAEQVAIRAPVEFTNLRRSAHPWVTDAGDTIWDRAPDQPRLSPEQLKAQHKGEARHRQH